MPSDQCLRAAEQNGAGGITSQAHDAINDCQSCAKRAYFDAASRNADAERAGAKASDNASSGYRG